MSSSIKDQPRYIVGIGGTISASSSSEALVRAVLDACEKMGATTQMFAGSDLAALPHFNPAAGSPRTAGETALVEAVRKADGIVIGSPGYHGGYSGLVKNAIDLLEDLRGDTRVYFDGRPVGLVVTAAGWQACGTTLSALRDVVHAMRGWPTSVGVAVNSVEQKIFDQQGALTHEGVATAVQAQAVQLMTFAQVSAS